MVVRVIALLSRQLFRLLLLCCRTSRSKDIELLVLRQEVVILRRQVKRPKVKPEERILLAVLQRLRPAWERTSPLVTPDTLRSWHRELSSTKCSRPRVWRSSAPRGEPRGRMPTPSALSGPFAPSAIEETRFGKTVWFALTVPG
jgi:hypothetical protein